MSLLPGKSRVKLTTLRLILNIIPIHFLKKKIAYFLYKTNEIGKQLIKSKSIFTQKLN